MKIVKPFIKGLTSFDETFRKLTLNVVKGIIYLKIMNGDDDGNSSGCSERVW